MRKKILIIEDEKMVADFYKNKLMQEGFDVYYTVSAEEGMRIALKIRPDLIIFDIMLTHEEGIEFLENLRREDEISFTPVIVLSNRDSKEMEKKAVDLGVKDYVVKGDHPPEEILMKINKYIKE